MGGSGWGVGGSAGGLAWGGGRARTLPLGHLLVLFGRLPRSNLGCMTLLVLHMLNSRLYPHHLKCDR